MKEYTLSADALVYAVVLCDQEGIYGVRNVLLGMKPDQVPAFVEKASEELEQASAGFLSFDGAFEMEEDFREIINRLCGCHTVVSAQKNCGKQESTFTCYLTVPGTPVMEQVGEDLYKLYPECDARKQLEAFLDAEKLCPAEMDECRVDSGLAAKRDVVGMKAAGIPEAVAEMIAGIRKGKGTQYSVDKIVNDEDAGGIVVVTGEAGAVALDVEYTETQELLAVKPVSAQALCEAISGFLAD